MALLVAIKRYSVRLLKVNFNMKLYFREMNIISKFLNPHILIEIVYFVADNMAQIINLTYKLICEFSIVSYNKFELLSEVL